jgi:acetyl-CoA carboxylase carboxyltransferase component
MGDDGGWDRPVADLERRRAAARAMGGEERLARRRDAGVGDVRGRLESLCDPGSFVEIGLLVGELPADALVAGVATIAGRPVAVGAEDFTVAGGSIGPGTASKRHRLVDLAVQERMPLVLLLDGAGHRPPRPDDPPATRAPNDLQAQADARDLVPMAVAVLGPSAGHGALSAPLADFTVMSPAGAIFTAGPPLVAASTGEEVDKAELGGPDVALASGVIHNRARDEDDALAQITRWLSYLPSSAWGRPPAAAGSDDQSRSVPEIGGIVPADHRRGYDMAEVVGSVFDAGTWFEVQPEFGPSLLTGLARLGGDPVAVVANQPTHLAGAIDHEAAAKAADFIDRADAFHLPLVFLTDNPGVMAGTASERAGILRHAAAMFAAQHRARVPKLQVTLRKAYGFGSSAMAMNPFDGQTLNLALPGVTFGAMPARGADEATGADEAEADGLAEAESASGYRAAAGLAVDEVIAPAEVRDRLLVGLRTSAGRRAGPTEPRR